MYESEWENEFEFEGEFEGEFEFEGEHECEAEGECEAEEFFGRLANLARQQWATPNSPLRRVALGAARAAATQGTQALGGFLGRRFGNESLGRRVGSVVDGGLQNLIPQAEYEFESEWEFEGEMNPLRRAYPDALMEHLGHAAAEAETEEEAEAFIGALIPMAARLIPRVAPAIMRAAPQLIRGAAGVVRTLRRNPATRQLVRTVPTIMRQTVADVARQVSRGQRITPQTAVRSLARQTASVLGNPRRCVHAYRRSRTLDRQHHRTAGAAIAPPRSAVAPR